MNTAETSADVSDTRSGVVHTARLETLNAAVHAALLAISSAAAVTIYFVGSRQLFVLEANPWWLRSTLLGFLLSGLLGVIIAVTGFRSLAAASEIDRLRQSGEHDRAEVVRILDESDGEMIRSLLGFQFWLFLIAGVAASALVIHAVTSGTIHLR
jgi:hypothetical protein